MIGASAPGKLMIAGEYVVLRGAWCLVAAVDRRAVARLGPAGDGSPPAGGDSPENASIPPEARVSRRRAEELLGAVPQPMTLDVSALRQDGRKLGLGSSAAGAAAAAGAVFAWHGRDVTDAAARREVLEVAMEGHRAVAPEGSGADVAASVLGGLVRFRRDGDRFEAEPLAWPEGLVHRVVWTGEPARTSDLVRRVEALAESDAATHRARMDALAEAAAGFVHAMAEERPTDVVAATRAHHRAMAALGEAAGAPIVEERLARVATLAEEAGGAAKPSGAGGGDVAIALFDDATAAARFDEACRRKSLALVSLQLGTEGVQPLGGS